MKILILASDQKTSSIKPEEWKSFNDHQLILYTNYIDESTNRETNSKFKDVFVKIVFFKNYSINDNIELQAIKEDIDLVVSYSEIDVLRAARIRTELGLSGIKESQAQPFRHKVLMKEVAQKNNIKVAEYSIVKNSIDLLKFIEEYGFPVVIKPVLGRSCKQTFILNDDKEVAEYLESGRISATLGEPKLLVEKFIDGDFYCIDCLYSKGEKVTLIGKYHTTPYDFYVEQKYGAVIRIPKTEEIYTLLDSFTKHLITNVYGVTSTELFHIEVFKKDDQLILCEIACRLGGLIINNEFNLVLNKDVKHLHLDYTLDHENKKYEVDQNMGWYVIPKCEYKTSPDLSKNLPSQIIESNLNDDNEFHEDQLYFIFKCESYENGNEIINTLSQLISKHIEFKDDKILKHQN